MVAFLCNRPSMFKTSAGWVKDDSTDCIRNPEDILDYCRKVTYTSCHFSLRRSCAWSTGFIRPRPVAQLIGTDGAVVPGRSRRGDALQPEQNISRLTTTKVGMIQFSECLFRKLYHTHFSIVKYFADTSLSQPNFCYFGC